MVRRAASRTQLAAYPLVLTSASLIGYTNTLSAIGDSCVLARITWR